MFTSINKSQIKYLAFGVLIAFALTAIALLVYAVLVTYTNMSENTLPIMIATTTLLAVMVAGFDAARGAPSKGWLWGMGAGFAYVLILLIIMIVALPTFSVDGRTFMVAVIGIAGGGLGGILGINLKR